MGSQTSAIKLPHFEQLVRNIDLPIDPKEYSQETHVLNRQVKQAKEYGFFPLNYSTHRSVCVHIMSLLKKSDLSMDEKADYAEATLKFLRRQSGWHAEITDKTLVVKPRNVSTELRQKATKWYTIQFLDVCEVKEAPKMCYSHLNLEYELFCLNRSLRPEYKETDIVCNRIKESFNTEELQREFAFYDWKDKNDKQNAKSFIQNFCGMKSFPQAPFSHFKGICQ
jgi:hypothetical protein